jgi:hypothetical protein
MVEEEEGRGLTMGVGRGLWMMCYSHVERRGEWCWV